MTDPDDTLSAIDAAIDGWNGYDDTVSDDAMRWAPEPPEVERRWRGAEANLAILDEAARVTPEQAEAFRRLADRVRQQQGAVLITIRALTKGFAKVTAHVHAATAPAAYGDEYRRHRRNCRACNPAGNPKPLKVNGADYARRRKNRRRRGR